MADGIAITTALCRGRGRGHRGTGAEGSKRGSDYRPGPASVACDPEKADATSPRGATASIMITLLSKGDPATRRR